MGQCAVPSLRNSTNTPCMCALKPTTSRTSTPIILLYSRCYAEDVTSVTSGASQGPHSFNLVFVCLFVSRLALSHICPVPYHQRQLAINSWPQYSNRAFKRKIIRWSNLEEWVWMRSVSGNACRAIVRVRIPDYALKKEEENWKIYNILCFFCLVKAVDGVVLPSTVPVLYHIVPSKTAGHNIQIGLSNARS